MGEEIRDPRYRALIEELRRHRPELDYPPRGPYAAPWDFEKFGDRFYRIYIAKGQTASDYAIVMTGSDVTTSLSIPFPHRWLRTDFYHTTSSPPTASQDALYVSIRRAAGTISPLTNFIEYLLDIYDVTDAEYGECWGENFEYEACVWGLVLNSTSTDLIYPIFYVERLGP